MDIDLQQELAEIESLIQATSLVSAVRREVKAVMDGAVVTGGSHKGMPNYDAVVVHNGDHNLIARRLRDSVANVAVDKIVDNMLGVRRV